jgi:hypothetical protein
MNGMNGMNGMNREARDDRDDRDDRDGCTLAKKWMGINTRRDPHGSLVTTPLSIYALMQPYQMKPN